MDNVTRWNFRVLGKALKTRRVVIISGARQCGKSTLLEMFFDGKVEIRSLDSKRLREAALLDPQSFVRYDGDGPMVIDEVQKAPELLSEIKLVVDRNRRPGQYVITGSSDIYSAPETDESLAGRVKNIRMRTFAQGEIQGVEPTFLDRLFANDYDSLYPDCDKRTVLDLAFRGGYPEVVRLSPEDRREWFQDYVKSLFSKDSVRSMTCLKQLPHGRRSISIPTRFSLRVDFPVPPTGSILGCWNATIFAKAWRPGQGRTMRVSANVRNGTCAIPVSWRLC